ncbi:hypothetical protein HY312_03440 [Candidatus Saccharibacteria bacterium]|nr:hypothetical protein [Candidatus Saccharibacteria bacterium]
MNSRIIITIGIIFIILGIGLATFFISNGGTLATNTAAKVEKGESLVATTQVKRSYTDEQFSSAVKESVSTLDKNSQDFGINKVDNPEEGWYVVTCTFDNAEDGSVAFAVKEDNETGTLKVIYNPLTMPNSEKSLLPKTVRDLLL